MIYNNMQGSTVPVIFMLDIGCLGELLETMASRPWVAAVGWW